MRLPLRRFIAALAVLAALWLAAGSAVASLVGCCPERQPCCVMASVQSPCSGCVPGPMPIGFGVAAAATPGRGSEPAYEPVAERAEPGPSIWRPPDEKSIKPPNSFNHL